MTRNLVRRGIAAIVLLIAAGCGGPIASSGMARAAAAAPSPRAETVIADGWRFRFGGDPAGVTDPSFDDSGWQAVSLPHTWNRVGDYSLTRSPASDTRRGPGWYRLRLDIPRLAAGQRHVLQFDGVGTIAEVWVNGVRVGTHQGAFSRFRFDVTDQLKPGGPNIVVVKADNSKAEAGSSTEHVLPLGGDFFIHGGIYRPVSLISTGATHIDLLDHGGPGVYITTPSVDAGGAAVDVRTLLRNRDVKARAPTVVTTIRDADGAVVATDRTPVRLAPGASDVVRRTLRIAQPRLWQGRESPHLYEATVELSDGARVIDRVVEPFGVRTFSFDPEKGFILNGRSVPLHGASRHQDRAGKGWALDREDHAEDLAIMAEMGVNTVRHAHYQHAQDWVSVADRAGMVVWAELPFVHEASLTNVEPTPQLIDNARAQLIELIRQNHNHPSIMMWSVGNEIDIQPALVAMRSGRPARPARALAMLRTLDQLARQEDATRPTVYADCCEATDIAIKGAEVLSDVAGITAYNRYYGWYYGRPGDVGPALDRLHARYKTTPIAISEFGAGGAFTQHTDNPEGGPVNAFGRPHPEEYQSWVHENTWPLLSARPYLAGSWIWNMFDFASTTREEGEATDLNDKGLVSYDRRTRKDAFYYYKANWSAQPVVHITGRRYRDRAYPVVDVRAYSNADRVSLTVNGKPAGEARCPDRICIWPDVALAAGNNAVIASATVDGRAITDTVQWTAPDANRGLSIDAGTLTGSTSAGGVRFGSDDFFVGGTSKDVNDAGIGGRRSAQPVAIAGTSDAVIHGSYREGAFQYDLSVPDGKWTVSLMMMEPDTDRPVRRTFDVIANGRAVLRKFDPAAAAGGSRTAVVRQFPVRVSGGRLRLAFVPRTGPAVVSAISLTR